MAQKDKKKQLLPKDIWDELSRQGLVPFKATHKSDTLKALQSMNAMRELETYIGQYGLGYVMRINIAFEVLKLKRSPEDLRATFVHALEDIYPKPVGTALKATTDSTLRTFFHLGSKKDPPKISMGCLNEVVQALCYLLHSEFGGDRDEKIAPKDFLYELFNKKSACEDFARRLRYGGHEDTPRVLTDERLLILNEGLKFHIGNNVDRKDFSQDLKDWVTGKVRPGRQLGVIHSPHSWTDLQSLALHIHKHVSESIDHDLKVIYIPLSTYGARRKDTHITGLSYGEILAVLKRFVDGKRIIQNPSPIKSARNRSKALLHIRRQLAKKPALIILSGYSERDGGAEQIKRIIKDDLIITTLIPNLLMPPTWYQKDHYDPNIWARNKILLLGNKTINNETIVEGPKGTKFVSPYRSLMAFNIHQKEFPRLPQKFSAAVFKAQNYSQRAEIRQLRDTLNIPIQDQHECVNHSLEALITAQKMFLPDVNLDEIDSQIKEKLKNSNASKNRLTDSVISVLFDVLGQHNPIWLVAIQFIALSPGGIRERVLVDLLHRFSRHSTLASPKLPTDRDLLKNKAHELIKHLEMIVSLGRIDEFEGAVEDEDLGDVAKKKRSTPTKSYCISYPEIRETILIQMKLGQKSRTLTQSLSVLLCEESFNQQAESIKKRTFYTDGRIGPYRRTIQGIYHGLESFQVAKRNDGLELVRPALSQNGLNVPLDPLSLWQYLWAFHYKTSLVRHSEWRLSRYFSRNQLKHELLSCFERPWLLDLKQTYQNMTIFDFMPKTAPNQFFLDDISISKAHVTMILGLHRYQLIEGSITGLEVSPQAQIKMQKHLFRSDIAEGQCDNVINRCDDGLLSNATTRDLLQKLNEIIEQGVEKCIDLVGENNFKPASSYPTTITQTNINTLCDALDPASCRQLIDLLNRKGEAIATKADLEWGEELSQSYEKVYESAIASGRSPSLNSDAIKHSPQFLQTFRVNSCKAFVTFEVAEHIRNFIFSKFPHLQISQISGHPTRTAIRQALVLERESRYIFTKKFPNRVTPPGFFAGHARMLLDELSRHLGRFLNERLYILTLEATFLRMLRHQERDWHKLDPDVRNIRKSENHMALDNALLYLNRAERIMMFVSPTSIGRIRFYNERQKIYSLLPRYKGKKFEKHLVELAKRDIEGMKRLASVLDTQLWSNIASIQSARLKMKYP